MMCGDNAMECVRAGSDVVGVVGVVDVFLEHQVVRDTALQAVHSVALVAHNSSQD